MSWLFASSTDGARAGGQAMRAATPDKIVDVQRCDSAIKGGSSTRMRLASFCFVVPVLVGLAGCAALQSPVWYKAGGTQDDFSRDRYTCLQQSQQRVSGAYVDQNSGAAQSTVVTNGQLFDACMNASGWYIRAPIQFQAPDSPPEQLTWKHRERELEGQETKRHQAALAPHTLILTRTQLNHYKASDSTLIATSNCAEPANGTRAELRYDPHSDADDDTLTLSSSVACKVTYAAQP
jgi:hypothetical protein